MASDIKERIAPAIQAYYKFHDIRLVHFGLLHKKPTEAHRPSVLVNYTRNRQRHTDLVCLSLQESSDRRIPLH